MKKPYLLTAVLFVFLALSPIAPALFTTSYDLNGTLQEETEAFFIGKTTMNGRFTGYPMEHVIDSAILQEMEGFPLLGACSLTHLDSVIVAEDIDISAATSLEDLIIKNYDHLTRYSDVDIITDNGLFLLGVHQGGINVSTTLAYAVTTFVTLEIIKDSTARFFVVGNNNPLLIHCSGNFSILTVLSDTSIIQVKDKHGQTRWSGGSSNDYLVIQDISFSITQHPPLYLFPMTGTSDNTELNLSVTPADPDDIKIIPLIENISDVLETHLKDNTTSEFLQELDQLNILLQTASFVANGAMVFLQTNDTVTIDRSTQQFSSVGFVRFDSLDITQNESSLGPNLQADCTLTFLGDHFYSSQASQSSDGIRFPYELIIIWILAICVFVYIRFFVRPPVNREKDDRVRRYALFIHIVILVIAFLLLDIEVNSIFGISALTALLSQGATTITGVFLFIEIIIWILGFFILAIPIQLLSYSILRLRGIGKGGNGIWKAIGDLSIWIFCGFYLLLFLNIIFSLIDFKSIFPMG